EFSLQNSQSWQPATVPNLPTVIGPENYFRSFTWTTTGDLFNLDTLVSLAITPYDNWQPGGGDTIVLHVDNQVLPLLENILPDTSATLPWYGSINLTFTGQINPSTADQGIVLVGEYSDTIQAQYSLTPQQSFTNLEIIPQTLPYAHETVTLTISPALKDLMGNPFDGNRNGDPDGALDTDTLTMTIDILGDYDQSGLVDFVDLVQFQQSWWQDTVGMSEEVGPAMGTPPYLQIQPDGLLNFEDLMVFTQMWNWSVGFDYGGRQLAKTRSDTSTSARLQVLYPQRKPGDPDDEFLLQLQLTDPRSVGALELVLDYNPETVEFQSYSSRLDEPWVTLVHHDQEHHVLIVNLADLKREPRALPREWLDITFKRKVKGETEVQWELDLRNRQTEVMEQSRQTFRFSTTPPLPRVYALHQNYPNPFNSTTTIKYDLPEDTHVRLVIYNILGQEVVTLRNGQETAGFKSLQWRGVDRQGRPVGAGLYFVVMSTDTYRSSRKLILLK
ncbi:MAG: T9SS type A sorting domain-containing protein, partial [Fidelibacterota bacterium]